MEPYVGEFGFKSTGPKVPIPKAVSLYEEKNFKIFATVSSGVVVGIMTSSIIFPNVSFTIIF